MATKLLMTNANDLGRLFKLLPNTPGSHEQSFLLKAKNLVGLLIKRVELKDGQNCCS